MSKPELVQSQEHILHLIADAQEFGFFVVDTHTQAVLSFNARALELWNLQHLERELRNGDIGSTTLFFHFQAQVAEHHAAESQSMWTPPTSTTHDTTVVSLADGRTLSLNVMPMPLQGRSDTAWLYLFEHVTAAAKRDSAERQFHHVKQLNVQLEWQAIALAEANARLNALAVTDGLTGLYNRRALHGLLSQEFARAQRYKSLLSIVVLDIDSFKSYNDTYGHLQGDQVLSGIGDILSASVRDTDSAARFGGDEFVLLLPETDAAGANAFAERCRAGIQTYAWQQGGNTASFGVATYSSLYHTESALMEDADRALYHAKRSGRNRVAHVSDIHR